MTRNITLLQAMLVAFVLGVLVTFIWGCINTPDPKELVFQQGFEGTIDLGTDNPYVYGKFDGYLYMDTGDGEWFGFVETRSHGLFVAGIDTKIGRQVEIWGTITRAFGTCFMAEVESHVAFFNGASIWGCEGQQRIRIQHENYPEDVHMIPVDPYHPYFYEEEAQ